ncbi:MAG: cytidine deaminase [Candidatus Sumerlaeia bacterium]|nr:cytidine deaminase [Candidatus Sumerlaeia bacterium]
MTEPSAEQIARLIEAAQAAREKAYAPYSHFAVGAALLGADGKTYIGCNVENASYGLTVCAERAAIVGAVAAGCRNFLALAVVADTGAENIVTPCGACRQVLAEFSPDLTVVCANLAGQTAAYRLGGLLPHRFDLE